MPEQVFDKPRLFQSPPIRSAEWAARWPAFSPREFSCKCGRFCNGEYQHSPSNLDRLQVARTLYGKPIHNNSGRRCRRHNANVGGVPNSQHLIGWAADLAIDWDHPEDVKRLVAALVKAGFKSIGLGGGFIHTDGRQDRERCWPYPGGSIGRWNRLYGFDVVDTVRAKGLKVLIGASLR